MSGAAGPDRTLNERPEVTDAKTSLASKSNHAASRSNLFKQSERTFAKIEEGVKEHCVEMIESARDHLRAERSVCSQGVAVSDIVQRHHLFRVPEHGLIDDDAGDEHVLGKKIAEACFAEVMTDEYRLQSPSYIGHMTGALPPWARGVSDLNTYMNLNNVKIETGKVSTAQERETMAMLHHTFYQFDDTFYEQCSQDPNSCLGHPTSGGTVANLEALWIARNAALPGAEKRGLAAAARTLQEGSKVDGLASGVLLCSDLVHYSIAKAVGVLGIGTESVISVPTTADLKIDLTALAATVARLTGSGERILAIIAVAGTTEAGSFDEITPMAALARKHNAWLHVDAAWGGGHIFGSKRLMDGVHLADSITVDGHKNLFTPVGCGAVLFRNPAAVKHIEKVSRYIIREGSHDTGRFTLEGTRPYTALHVRTSLLALGRAGARALFDRKLAAAAAFGAAVKAAADFELVCEPESDIVLFRVLPPGWTHEPALLHLATLEEARENTLSEWQVRVQEAQKEAGRTFVSRTTIRHPRKITAAAAGGPRVKGPSITVLRAVINLQVDEEDILRMLADLRTISMALALGAKPLAEATTLLQPLGHALLTCPDAIACCSSSGAKAEAATATKEEAAGAAAGFGALTYRTLVTEALHVASSLLTSPAGHVLPIMVERNVDAYVAIVAATMRSCAWLLIDASLPARRVAHMLSEATPAAEILVAASRRVALQAALQELEPATAETFTPRELTPFLGALRKLPAEERWEAPTPPPPSPAGDGDAADAYMVFTSGSTGLPKAVKISQLQLVNLLRAFRERWGGDFKAGRDATIAQIAWAWDMHTLDAWLPLAQGATVRILREDERLDGARVASAIAEVDSAARRHGGALRWIQGTPTFYQTVLRGGWLGGGSSELTAISSGEPMSPELARSLLLRSGRLVNCYGLTEGTIFQSFEELTLPTSPSGSSRDAAGSALALPDVSCGRPCYSAADDAKCAVLLLRVREGAGLPRVADAEAEQEGDDDDDDETRRAKAVCRSLPLEVVSGPGSIGQIAFGGSCLPRQGYHNAPELNERKFVPDPRPSLESPLPGTAPTEADVRSGSLMLSGDLGCWRPDGKLQVLGRVDSMVKVLGSRVDLTEIKAALCEQRALVADAVITDVKVATKGADAGSKLETQLVGYYVPTSAANAAATSTGLASIGDEVELWEEIYDGAYAKKDAVGEADDAKHGVAGGAIAKATDDAAKAAGEKAAEEELAGKSAEDLITNWSAYISSYSGKLWPRSTIEHWVNATVDRVLDRKPRRILEHGCGMLAFRMALRPEVEEVWMADLSGEACRYLEAVASHPHFAHIKHKVKVLHRPADNFDGVPDDYFDVVVLSAMIMYFPSIAYVSDVMRKSSRALRAGGCVYVGDCRSLEHTQHFHTDVVLFNSADSAPASELRRACFARVAAEKELLISPDYWYRHAELLPGCFDACAILLRRGYDCPKVHEPGADPRHADAPVEMTRWRYDAWLVKGGTVEGVPSAVKAAPSVRELPFRGEEATFDAAIEAMRADASLDAVLVRNVPNARVLDAVGCELVVDDLIVTNPHATVAEARAAIAAHIKGALAASNGGKGVCVERLLERVERAGGGVLSAQTMFTPSASVHVVGATHGTSLTAHLFDVLLYRLDAPAEMRPPRFRTGELHTQVDWGRLQVSPLVSTLRKIELGSGAQGRSSGPALPLEAYGNKRKWTDVTRGLTAALRADLPSFAVPVRLVPVDVMPVLPTGKVDKKALPSARAAILSADRSGRSVPFREAQTPTETGLIEIFGKLFLGADRAEATEQVGADDDFGDLGGNSLSAGRLVGVCRERFGVQIAMIDVFEKRTPAKIAKVVDELLLEQRDDLPASPKGILKHQGPHGPASENSATMTGVASSTTSYDKLDSLNDSDREESVASSDNRRSITFGDDVHARDKEASEEASLEEADKEDKAATTHMDFTIPVPAEPRLGTSCASEAGQRAAGHAATTYSGGGILNLHARVWWPSNPTAIGCTPLVVDFAPYPLSYMTAAADQATFGALAAKGATCVRVQARGTDSSEGQCADPYEIARVHVPDLLAVIDWLCNGDLASVGSFNKWQANYPSVFLHGFSWAATAALRVAALPTALRPASIKAVCLCMGNDELHESDVFFERHVPLAYNFTWSTQFLMFAARPPSDLPEGWQERWLERLDAQAHLPAKYLRASRQPGEDPFWAAQSLSGVADPALEGASSDAALLAGLGKVAVPVLAAGAYGLGRYSDAVERLVRSRGLGAASAGLPEVRGLLGPWAHQLPHLSPVGPNIDWVDEVASFIQRHSAAEAPPPKSSLTYFACEELPLGPALPSSYPGCFREVSATELAASAAATHAAAAGGEAGGQATRLVAAANGSLHAVAAREAEPRRSAGFDGVVPDEIVGAASGEWFSWGLAPDLAANQLEDDAKSLCVDLPQTRARLEVSGRPVVKAWLAAGAAKRALEAPPGGTDCLVARLCVVSADGAVSRLGAIGAASLTLAKPVADERGQSAAARAAAPPLALLEIDLHFATFEVQPGETLRLALSSSYFPMFLTTGTHGAIELANLELTLPKLGGAEVRVPPPQLALAAGAQTLQRVRMAKQARHVLRDGEEAGVQAGARITVDDGTVQTTDGLAVSSRGEIFVAIRAGHGRRLSADIAFTSTLAKEHEHARLDVESHLQAARGEAGKATLRTTLRAIANGALIWSKVFEDGIRL